MLHQLLSYTRGGEEFHASFLPSDTDSTTSNSTSINNITATASSTHDGVAAADSMVSAEVIQRKQWKVWRGWDIAPVFARKALEMLRSLYLQSLPPSPSPSPSSSSASDITRQTAYLHDIAMVLFHIIGSICLPAEVAASVPENTESLAETRITSDRPGKSLMFGITKLLSLFLSTRMGRL